MDSKGGYSRRNMEPERISFPTEYPIKVVAKAATDLRSAVDAVFERHFGALPTGCVTQRSSAQSNFVALTYVVTVQNEAQLTALNAELRRMEAVVMVL
jgi:putative lipoic acid-binding regulatory protein